MTADGMSVISLDWRLENLIPVHFGENGFMAIFAGRYRWDGTKKGDQEPIAWFSGCYEVKLFKRASSSLKVQYLKPFVCVYAPTGEGQSISANPEKFAKQLCTDFSLHIEQVLWVEDLLKEEGRYEVIMFTRSGKMGNRVFYRLEKRMALESEIRMIQRELSELAGQIE
jgi:hypothetical protein